MTSDDHTEPLDGRAVFDILSGLETADLRTLYSELRAVLTARGEID